MRASSRTRSVWRSRSLVGSSRTMTLPPLAEELRELDAVALAARELADARLLDRAREQEAREVVARRGACASCPRRWMQSDEPPPGDLLVDGLVRVERVAALVDVAERDGLCRRSTAPVGLLQAHEHAHERRLAGAVGSDDPDDPARAGARTRSARRGPCRRTSSTGSDDDAPWSARRAPEGSWSSTSPRSSARCDLLCSSRSVS